MGMQGPGRVMKKLIPVGVLTLLLPQLTRQVRDRRAGVQTGSG